MTIQQQQQRHFKMIVSHYCNSFANIPIYLTWKLLANSSATKLLSNRVESVRKKKEKFTVILGPSHLVVLMRQGKRKSELKCKSARAGDCFWLIRPYCLCDALVHTKLAATLLLGSLISQLRLRQATLACFTKQWGERRL